LKEKQQLLFLEVPLGLNYQHGLTEKVRILATLGVKISVPLQPTYKTTGGEIVTTGYYDQWNVELSDLPQYGFNTITEQLKGDVSVKSSYSGFADLGAVYGLSSKVDLYAGGYVNYGLNNVAKSTSKSLYQKDGVYNGVLGCNQTDNAKTVSVGLKFGVIWHFGNKKAAVEKESPVEIVDALPVVPKAAIAEKTTQATEVPKAVIVEQPVAKVITAPNAVPEDDAIQEQELSRHRHK
jgi:hypothetical protein